MGQNQGQGIGMYPRRFTPQSAAAGFTLIELMITIAVVAILATIAISTYQDQIVKSRRSAAAACLQQSAQFMERYYTTHLRYDSDPPAVIAACDTEVGQHYDVELVPSSLQAKAFTLQAVPKHSQEAKDTLCGTLTINQQGVRGASGSASATPDKCW
ncbi:MULTISPECIES: type IV pilin protein [unclassified Pseudoxanthomonas]|uniref:type IV pilin protein n=1 Tax=unclassified Pseudoxanthomonas TaxID=2645906 RepID=UPI0030778D76